MKTPSKSGEEQIIDKNEDLIQLLNHTEREWEAFKQGKLRNASRRSSTGSAAASFLEYSLDHLLEHSPRELMYSLQRASVGDFGERSLDSAVEEVFMERRDGIMSGRIKGRRLFAEGADAVELELNYDDGGGDSLSKSGERDLPDTVSISCLSEESLSEEKEVVAEEKGCLDCGGGGGGGGGGCAVAMPWLVFLLILVIIGLISMSWYGKYVCENELFLVPT